MEAQTEIQKGRSQLNLFEVTEEDWLEKARKMARRICYLNKSHNRYGPEFVNCVTMDMVREEMDIKMDEKGLNSNNRNGAIFAKGFTRVGYIRSKAEGSHGNLIGIWKIKN